MKRILSFLLCLCMILALVPGTAAFAAKAEELVLDGNNQALCPACNETVTWTAYSGSNRLGSFTDGKHRHYYLSGDVTAGSINASLFRQASGSDVCLHLNGHDIVSSAYIQVDKSTLNIMGTGNVTFTGTASTTTGYWKYGFMVSGDVNLLGGNYYLAEKALENGIPMIYQTSGTTILGDVTMTGLANITGGSLKLTKSASMESIKIDADSKLTVAQGWIGTAQASFDAALTDNLVPAANGVAEGTFTGALTMPDGISLIWAEGGRLKASGFNAGLVLDENNQALCPACNKTVTWTAYSGSKRLGSFTDGVHRHYYLSGDVTAQSITASLFRLASKSHLCLHLNGHDIISGAYMQVAGSTLNIMGTGNVTFTATTTGDTGYKLAGLFVSSADAVANLYGGTFGVADTAAEEGRPFVYLEKGQVTASNNVIITGDTAVYGGTFTLKDRVVAAAIQVEESGKLYVQKNWTGTAAVSFAAALQNGVVPVANGAAEGVFDGKLTSIGGGTLIGTAEGTLVLDDLNKDLALNADNEALCPKCNEVVSWTALTGTNRLGTFQDGKHYHYYLAGDVTVRNAGTNFVRLASGTKMCLHLNGHDIIHGERMFLVAGTVLSIMGHGSVTFTATTTDSREEIREAGILSSGTVNLLGGTYAIAETAITEGRPYIRQTSGTLTVGDATIDGPCELSGGTVTVDAQATLKDLQVGTAGKLLVKKSWIGSAEVNFMAELLDNIVPTANAEAEDSFAGSLKMADGSTLKGYEDGTIRRVTTLELDADGWGFCPACNAKVQWSAYSGSNRLGSFTDGKHRHYYLSGDVTAQSITASLFRQASGSDVCLHLNNHNIITGAYIHVDGSTLNIMGVGNVTFTATSTGDAGYRKYGFFGSGTINLLGGSYAVAEAALETGVPVIYQTSGTTVLGDVNMTGLANIRGGSLTLEKTATLESIIIDTDSKLTVAAGWAGTAQAHFNGGLVDGQVPEANGASTGTFIGGLLLEDGTMLKGEDGLLKMHDYKTLLLNDASRGYCKVCNKVVTWSPIGAGDAVENHQTAGGAHAHFYIAEDNITAKNAEFMYVKENSVVCLHLNGKSIKIPGRIRLMNGTLNVLGDGYVDFIATTATEALNSQLFYCYGTPYNLSKLNLYGGTYTSSAGKPVIYGYGTYYTVMALVKLYGNTHIDGLVNIDQCQLYLNDGATVNNIRASNTGSIRVDKSWYGTAKVDYLAEVYEEYVNIFNGRSTGDFTGGLVMTDGRRLVGESGKLRAVSAMELRLDAENKGYCPVCHEVVSWTALSGSKTLGSYADGQHRHFYLSGDLNTDLLHLSASSDVCVHLNGHDLTHSAAMTVESGSSLTILGDGKVIFTGTSGLGGIVNAGTVNLLGGSYTSKTLPALYVTDGRISVKDVAVEGDSYLKKGTLALDGAATLVSIHVEAAGLLSVADSWAGTAAVEFLSGLTGTQAPSSNVSMGKATGKLTLLDGRLLEAQPDGVTVSGLNVSENLSYRLYEDHAELLSYTGSGTFLLPVQIAGKPVTKIASGAFTSFSGQLYIGKSDEFGLSYARGAGLSFTEIAAINGTAGYATVEEALGAFQTGFVQLLTDAGSITVHKDTYLDLNGFDVQNVTVTSGTLYVMDSQTDDFTVADGNYGKITGTVTGTVKGVPADAACAQYGYLQVKQEEGISFHCVAMDISVMTLRPDVAGVYYGCTFAADEVVAPLVKSYGLALSVYGDPDETRKDWLGSDFKVFNAGENKKGAVLANVMKKGIADLDNQVRANTPVYGRLYIKTESGYVFGQTVCRDLQEQVELTDQKWETLNKDLREKTHTMYESYKTVMGDWDVSNAPNYVDRIWFKKPAPDTGAGWEQYSLPIGNGYLGTSVFGGTETETLALADKTMFNPTSSATEATDVPAGEEVMASSIGSNGFTNLCKVHIDFGHEFDQVTDYQRDLLLDTAQARVNYTYKGVTYNRTYFANYPDNVTVAKLTASQKGKLTFTLRPEPTYIRDYLFVKGDGLGKTGTVTASGDTSILSGTLSAYQINYEAQFKVIPTGGTMTANADGTITVENADSAVILISAGTNYELTAEVLTAANKEKLNPNSYPHDKVTATINAAAKKSYEELLQTHLEDYRGLYARVEADLGGEPSTTVPTDVQMQAYRDGQHSAYIEELLFKHGRYLLICSSREGTLPTNLQGMWQYYASGAWRGGYVYNINLQMNYWSCYATNLADLFNANIEFFDVMRPTLEQNADNYLTGVKSPYISEKGTGANGIAVGAYGTPYVSPKVSTSVSTHSGPATTAYTTSLFWDYYEFTGDKEVLRNVVYPYIEGAAIFLSKTLENYDGKWLVTQSASPENNMWFEEPFVTKGTMFDQQFIYETYCQVLEAAEILGYTEADHPILSTINQQIDKLDHVIVGKSGHIKEFREEEYYGEFGRYEHHGMAQLVGVYPAAIITSETDAWQDAATVTATERGINYTGHQSAFKQLVWARLGNADYAYLLAQDHITKYLRDNLWNTHTPYQIDGNFGYTAGVAEMLIQSHEGYISVLPALPKAWAATGSFKGLTARGGFEVDTAWKDGSATEIRITSTIGGDCSVKYYSLSTAKVTDSKGNAVSFTANDRDIITFATVAGETYTITELSEKVYVEAPANLVITDGTKLSWEASPDAVSYKVYRAVNSQGTYELVADKVTGTTYTYVPTDLKTGDQLILRVTAVNADGVESTGIRTITWIP